MYKVVIILLLATVAHSAVDQTLTRKEVVQIIRDGNKVVQSFLDEVTQLLNDEYVQKLLYDVTEVFLDDVVQSLLNSEVVQSLGNSDVVQSLLVNVTQILRDSKVVKRFTQKFRTDVRKIIWVKVFDKILNSDVVRNLGDGEFQRNLRENVLQSFRDGKVVENILGVAQTLLDSEDQQSLTNEVTHLFGAIAPGIFLDITQGFLTVQSLPDDFLLGLLNYVLEDFVLYVKEFIQDEVKMLLNEVKNALGDKVREFFSTDDFWLVVFDNVRQGIRDGKVPKILRDEVPERLRKSQLVKRLFNFATSFFRDDKVVKSLIDDLLHGLINDVVPQNFRIFERQCSLLLPSRLRCHLCTQACKYVHNRYGGQCGISPNDGRYVCICNETSPAGGVSARADVQCGYLTDENYRALTDLLGLPRSQFGKFRVFNLSF